VGNLRRQFLTEAFLTTLLAFALGYALAILLLPFFNGYAGRSLTFSFERYPALLWMNIAFIAIVTLLSGGYPAWMLSSFRAVDVLKSRLRFGGSNGFTRSLVTLQFVLSTGLIIAAVVMVQQLQYMRSKDPGFAKENVVVVNAHNIPDIKKLYTRFKQGLSGNPGISGVASADIGLGDHEGISVRRYNDEGRLMEFHPFFVDPDYVRVLGMQLIAGRDLSERIAADSVHSVLINETMARSLGWSPAAAIGRQLKKIQSGDSAAPPTVVGVVKDINYQGMDMAIQPQLFNAFKGGIPGHFFVRIRPGDPSRALAIIKKEWEKAAPGYSLQYRFLDEDLERYYIAEGRLSHIVSWAGGVSIVLACLGLLGLAMLTALNRTREIGIRKILGASLQGIVGLISRDFLRLVTLALVIAIPLAWYFMHRWLDGYYYRIQLSWWVYALPCVSVLAVAWFTVALQALKAAQANPVESLRVE
jgi:putative ABC transport system permease protein